MSIMDLDSEKFREICNSIKSYQTNDMFVEEILNYFEDIYDVIKEIAEVEEIKIGGYNINKNNNYPASFKKKSLQIFERFISKRFSTIQRKIPEELRVIVETELVRMVNEFFEGIVKVPDISNEIWKKLIDVASDLYIDYYLKYVKT